MKPKKRNWSAWERTNSSDEKDSLTILKEKENSYELVNERKAEIDRLKLIFII